MVCPLEIRNIYVSSTNRNLTQDPYGNTYTLYISTPIKDITMVELMYASVPNTMYNLTNGSNVIGFTNTADPVGSPITLETLPNGFYGATGLATEVTNACFPNSNVVTTWLQNEGVFMFSRTVSNFQMNVVTQEMANMLGFDNPGVYTSVDASTTPYANNLRYAGRFFIKSQKIADLNVNDGVFLDIQELRSIFNECAPQGAPYGNANSQNASRSFGMIPMDVGSGCIKKFKKMNDFDSQIDYIYPIQKLDRLTIRWTDKNNNLLNFNGANDNAFILRFHTLRRNLC